MSLAKFSYMFFYLRMFQINSRFRILTFGCMAVVAMWWTANILQIFLICQPFAMNWDSTIQGHCGNRPLTYALVGAVNILTDVTTLLLPVPTVWKLQMPLQLKLLSLLFSALVCCMSSLSPPPSLSRCCVSCKSDTDVLFIQYHGHQHHSHAVSNRPLLHRNKQFYGRPGILDSRGTLSRRHKRLPAGHTPVHHADNTGPFILQRTPIQLSKG